MVEKTRFVVDLGEVKLSEDAKKKIEKDIQQVVMNDLAVLDISNGFRLFKFPEWWGIIYRGPETIPGLEIENLDKSIYTGKFK